MIWKEFIKGVLVLLISAMLIGGGVFAVAGETPENDNYRYTVKAEQVNDNEMPESHTDYENLTKAEQKVLFKAFKKSDHFFGSSSVTVTVDEKVNFFDGWEVVRIEGVPILVAVSGPHAGEMPRFMEIILGAVMFFSGCAGVLLSLVPLDIAINGRKYHRSA